MINIFGIDKKLSQGSYVVTPKDSLFEVLRKLKDGQVVLKNIIHEGSRQKELFFKKLSLFV